MPRKEEHFGKGLALYGQNKHEAVEAIQRAIEINPQEPMYHTSLSTVYRDMGRIPEAEEEMAISFQLQRG